MLKRVLPVILSVIFALSFVAVPSSAFAAKDDYGVDVSATNMSVGSDTSYQSVRLALQALDDAGIILCVSSGNETQDVSMYGTMGGLSRAGDTIIVQDFATDYEELSILPSTPNSTSDLAYSGDPTVVDGKLMMLVCSRDVYRQESLTLSAWSFDTTTDTASVLSGSASSPWTESSEELEFGHLQRRHLFMRLCGREDLGVRRKHRHHVGPVRRGSPARLL